MNSYDYGARFFDPRVGRFLSLDPVMKNFPQLSPFQYASNRPIDGIDLDGLEWVSTKTAKKGNKTIIKKQVFLQVINNSKKINKEKAFNLALKIAKQTEISYSGEMGKNKEMEVSVVITMVDDVDKSKLNTYNDFYLEFTDNLIAPRATGRESGYTDRIGDTQFNRIQLDVYDQGVVLSDESIIRSGAHELGHTGGLRHYDDYDLSKDWDIVSEIMDDSKNLMRQSVETDGTSILPIQRREINNEVKKDEKQK